MTMLAHAYRMYILFTFMTDINQIIILTVPEPGTVNFKFFSALTSGFLFPPCLSVLRCGDA